MAIDYDRSITPAGMDLKQTALLLKTRKDALVSKQAAIGSFYYPSGVVKKINVYW